MDNMTNVCNPEKLQYIIDCLPTEELLAQLAEEATELAQAALKLRRVLDGTNPTPVPKEDALKDIYEEVADVLLILETLDMGDELADRYRQIMARKVDRWAQRLDWGSEE